MSTKPLMLEGVVPDPEDATLRKLERDNQQLRDDLRHAKQELEEARAENDKLKRSIKAIQKPLSGLYQGLRALFGEIEFAVGEDDGYATTQPGVTVTSGDEGRWSAIKAKMPPRHQQLIELLLLQRSMKRTQIAAALGMDYSNCTKNVIGILLRQGWLIDNGGELSLKQL